MSLIRKLVDGKAFAGVAGEILEKLNPTLFKERSFKKGEIILHQEEIAQSIFFIIEGTVELYKEMEDGKKCHLEGKKAGDFLGEMGILLNTSRFAYAVCETEVLTIEMKAYAFKSLIDLIPDIRSNVVKNSILNTTENLLTESARGNLLSRMLNEIKEQKELLEVSNQKLEKASEVINSSLRYARRIQNAILPPPETLALFSDSFLIFKPRDIVSGDFYWLANFGDVTYVAVADCTGHGVPGALLSIIGLMLLNRVTMGAKKSPSQILVELHEGLRSALKQEGFEASTQDGMDLSLVAIKEDKLIFAGAKRPLFLAHGESIREIKGDKKSVGGKQKEEHRSYEEHQISYHKGDIIYLCSDGFLDQHNFQNKRIGSVKFKHLLNSVCSLPLSMQKERFEEFLRAHQGGVNQRDDITILGVQL